MRYLILVLISIGNPPILIKVTRSEDSGMIFAGNLLFHNNNTVFVSAFFQFMDFNRVVKLLQPCVGIRKTL